MKKVNWYIAALLGSAAIVIFIALFVYLLYQNESTLHGGNIKLFECYLLSPHKVMVILLGRNHIVNLPEISGYLTGIKEMFFLATLPILELFK